MYLSTYNKLSMGLLMEADIVMVLNLFKFGFYVQCMTDLGTYQNHEGLVQC